MAPAVINIERCNMNSNIILPRRRRIEELAKMVNRKIEVPDSMVPGGFVEIFDKDINLIEVAHNLIPAAARSYLIKAGVAGGAQNSAYYIAPWATATDPADNLTAANFESSLDEFTNYTEANRPAWTQDAEAGGAIANAGSMAQITADVGGGTINGIALLTVATKGSAGGLLLAATRFTTRTLQAGDVLFFRYTLQFNLPA
jgi:hypothetical protein